VKLEEKGQESQNLLTFVRSSSTVIFCLRVVFRKPRLDHRFLPDGMGWKSREGETNRIRIFKLMVLREQGKLANHPNYWFMQVTACKIPELVHAQISLTLENTYWKIGLRIKRWGFWKATRYVRIPREYAATRCSEPVRMGRWSQIKLSCLLVVKGHARKCRDYRYIKRKRCAMIGEKGRGVMWWVQATRSRHGCINKWQLWRSGCHAKVW